MMELILSAKGDLSKLKLDDVELVLEHKNTLTVIFNDGRARSYPLMHLWYWEQQMPEARSKP